MQNQTLIVTLTVQTIHDKTTPSVHSIHDQTTLFVHSRGVDLVSTLGGPEKKNLPRKSTRCDLCRRPVVGFWCSGGLRPVGEG